MILGLLAKGSLVAVTFAGAVIGSRIVSKNSGKTSVIAGGGAKLDTGGTTDSENKTQENTPSSSTSQDNQQDLRKDPQPSVDNPTSLPSRPEARGDSVPSVLSQANPSPQASQDLFSKGSNPVKDPSLTQKPNAIPPSPQTLTQPEPSNSIPEKLDTPELRTILDNLGDYTFQISSPCSKSTGWILDYQVTEGNKKYPTVWYFVTSLESIRHWLFGSNTYGQKLPISIDDWKGAGRRNAFRFQQCHIEKRAYDHKNYGLEILSTKDYTPKKDVVSEKIKDFKLFFSGLNLFDDRNDKEGINHKMNYKDFAVIEVTFPNEHIAEKVTKGFARKYKTDDRSVKLNVLGSSVGETFDNSIDRLEKSSTNYYSLSYSGNVKEKNLKLFKNWNNNYEGERLSHGPRNQSLYSSFLNQNVKGYLNGAKLPSAELEWSDKKHHRYGHLHLLQGDNSLNENEYTSGAMVVDGKGNVLGIKSDFWGVTRHQNTKYSAVVPLRSTQRPFNGNVLSPAYDLIKGVTGQKNSYKQQLESHVLNKNQRTWLSITNNWTVPAKAK